MGRFMQMAGASPGLRSQTPQRGSQGHILKQVDGIDQSCCMSRDSPTTENADSVSTLLIWWEKGREKEIRKGENGKEEKEGRRAGRKAGRHGFVAWVIRVTQFPCIASIRSQEWVQSCLALHGIRLLEIHVLHILFILHPW